MISVPAPPSSATWHHYQRERLVPLHALRPGVHLPPRRSWTEGLGQAVLDVQYGAPANTLLIHDYDAAETYELLISQDGVNCPTFRLDPVPEEWRPPEGRPGPEPLEFSIDWRRVPDRFPRADELQPGDVLPPRRPVPGDDANVIDAGGQQRVVKVAMQYDARLVVTVRDFRSTARFTFAADELVQFPRLTQRGASTVKLPAAGPDRWLAALDACRRASVWAWARHPVTQQVFCLIQHPYGRGRWPTFVPDFDPLMVHRSAKPLVVRLPINAEESRRFESLVRLPPADVPDEWVAERVIGPRTDELLTPAEVIQRYPLVYGAPAGTGTP